jgi:cytochrome c553
MVRRPIASAAVALLLAAPAAAGDAARGRTRASACVVCHGPLGVSTQPDAPNLAGQPADYLVAQLRAYRSGKRAHEVMTVMSKGLGDTEIEDLAAWYASIRVTAEDPGKR